MGLGVGGFDWVLEVTNDFAPEPPTWPHAARSKTDAKTDNEGGMGGLRRGTVRDYPSLYRRRQSLVMEGGALRDALGIPGGGAHVSSCRTIPENQWMAVAGLSFRFRTPRSPLQRVGPSPTSVGKSQEYVFEGGRSGRDGDVPQPESL